MKTELIEILKLYPMTLELALALTGGLSDPAKMPCRAYALPTEACRKGWELRQSAGDWICKLCYAAGHHYRTGIVNAKMQERLLSLKNEQWVEAMIFLISKIESKDVFRWHDSGDLQGQWHLDNIVKVADGCPNVRFWLPTIEYDIVEQYLIDGGIIPRNLQIRLSAEEIDKPDPVRRVVKNLNAYHSVKNKMGISWVTRNIDNATCEATTVRNKCEHCRDCWNVKEVVYYLH